MTLPDQPRLPAMTRAGTVTAPPALSTVERHVTLSSGTVLGGARCGPSASIIEPAARASLLPRTSAPTIVDATDTSGGEAGWTDDAHRS